MTATIRLVAISVAALVWHRERQARRSAERFGAALFESLLNAIDANDEDTGCHVRRVAVHAHALAEAAGLDADEQRQVEHVALFHDIGKIHAALFDIVHEGHKLTRAERDAVATHPARGAEVLAPLEPFYPYLAAGVLGHHERWDGGGYPQGLAGEAIPLSARIVAIADSYDAITHSRRYSAGQSADAALEAIRRGRGAQFDPALVDLFLSEEVQERVRAAGEELSGRPRRRHERRQRFRHEPFAPEVAFRWRERRSAGFQPSRSLPAPPEELRPRKDGSGPATGVGKTTGRVAKDTAPRADARTIGAAASPGQPVSPGQPEAR